MSLRRSLVLPLIMTAAVAAAPAMAAEVHPFDGRAFAAAQRAGRAILIDVYADWCPTCRAQGPAIARAINAPWAANLLVFRLNFDKQREDWRRLGVRSQSTLIAYRGANETGRSVGDTDPERIAQLIRSPLR